MDRTLLFEDPPGSSFPDIEFGSVRWNEAESSHRIRRVHYPAIVSPQLITWTGGYAL